MEQTKERLGKRANRLDAIDKVTGRARYASDITLPNMLHGVIVRSDRPHARIVRIDAGAARDVPGVAVVVTAADAPGKFGTTEAGGAAEAEAPGKFGEAIKDQPVFAHDRVRYIGEPVAAIAADSAEIARSAAELIEIEYEDLEPIFDPEDALKEGAPLIHEAFDEYAAPEGLIRKGNACGMVTIDRGDVEEAFRTAEHIFEDVYAAHSVHQTPMETRAAVADVDAQGAVTVYASTQHPFGVRAQIAEALSVPLTDIRVVTPPVGGAFGSKLEANVEMYAVILARKARRPVKIMNTREEDLSTGNPRHPMTFYLKSAVDADGNLTGRRVRIVMDAGAYGIGSPVLTGVAANLAPGPYRIPNVHIDVVAAYTNKVAFGAYRGPTGPQTVFAVESHTDAIARRLGVDPLEFRLKHAFREGDVAHNGQRLDAVSLPEVLEKAAAAIGWGERPGPGPQGELVGKGLACGWWTTTAGAAACSVKMNEDGTVVVQTGASEIGTGAVMAGIAQIVAAEMAIDLEKVKVVWGDTEATPYDAGAQGSRTVFNMGRAARDAAVDVRDQLLQKAAERLEADVHDLEIRDGQVLVRGVPDSAISYADLMAGAMWATGAVAATASFLAEPPPYDSVHVRGSLYPTFNSPSFHCHAAEVAVDPQTGLVRVRTMVVAQDVGFAVNPTYLEGQMQGGAAQAAGFAISEELHFDDGRIVNPNLALYKLPTAADAPSIKPVIVECPSTAGLYGMKGAGEPPVIFGGAAIANAVFDAIGVQIHETPLTPERVYRTMKGAGG